MIIDCILQQFLGSIQERLRVPHRKYVVNELQQQVVDVRLCLSAISLTTCSFGNICEEVLHCFPDLFEKRRENGRNVTYGLCGQRHGLAMNWVDRPRTSADERDVVWAPRCRDYVWAVAGFGRFCIDLSFLREQSP